MKAKFGRYVFLERLAVGGMAEIFLARRLSFGGFAQFVVVKRMRPEHLGKPAYESLFLSEARTGAALNHPNIVALHDLGKLDDVYFMAMEYVPGRSLADVIARAAKARRPVPLGVALRVGQAVASALHHAHHAPDVDGSPLRIIHHDITPQNVQLGYQGEVKLLDFGVATRQGRPAAGGRRGKFGYMSPEALRREPLDHRSDVYSLGVVMYELTTGRRLYKGNDNEAPEAPPEVVPPTQLDAHYPPSLQEAVLRALAHDREIRFADARSFGAALANVAKRVGCDTGDEAQEAYLRALYGIEIEEHRARLEKLAAAAAPKARPEPPPKAAPAEKAPDAAPSPEPDAPGASGEALPPTNTALFEALTDGVPPEDSGVFERLPDQLPSQVSGVFDAMPDGVPPPKPEAPPAPAPPPVPAAGPPPIPAEPTAPVARPARRAPTALVAGAALLVGLAGGFLVGRALAGGGDEGSLRIESVPAGARAFDGDRLLGITPFETRRVHVGDTMNLRVIHPGHRDWAGQVAITASQPHQAVTVVLSPGG